MTVRLTPRERVEDLREFYDAVSVESAAEMATRMIPAQRALLGRLLEEQAFLLERGRPSPRLDPAFAAAAAGDADSMGWRVAVARARRQVMRQALGSPRHEPQPQRGAVDVLSLCSGIGGLDIGLKRAVPEARVVGYVEGEPACQEILLARMAGGLLDRAPVYGNLTSFDGRPWRGLVDCVVGGFPCQPFSTAGTRRGALDSRYLWPHVARVVGEVRPEWCFFENVRGLVSRPELRDIVGDLTGMDYRVALGLFPASELGAPHRRERLFILAHSNAHGLHERAALQGGEPVADRHGGGCAAVQGQEAAAGVAALGDPGVSSAAKHLVPLARRRTRPGSWPPRRDSSQAWRGVRAVDPSLLPSLKKGSRRRLNPDFVEWLMGLPRGWTEGPSLVARLRVLGNAVVPAVAALAWLELSAALSASDN